MKCDVLVVGAGCSGSVCTLKLAKEGFDVVVAEKESCFGGHTNPKIDITEDKGLNEIINELKLPVLFKTNKSKWFSRNYSFTWKSKVYDLYLKRGPTEDSFEVKVMNSAMDAKAQVSFNAIPKKLNFKGSIVDSIKLAVNGKIEVVKPGIIVGADGFNSQIAKLSGLSVYTGIASIVGYGILGEKFDMPEGITYILYDREYAPGGYFYIGKTSAGEGVACVVLDKSLVSKTPQHYYEKFVKKNNTLKGILSKVKPTNTFVGKSTAGLMKKRVIGNILLIGDAARTLDPLFGYGTRNSLLSGYMGAENIQKALERDNLKALVNYDEELKSIISEIREFAETRRLLMGFNNRKLDDMIRTREILSYLDR